MSEDPKFGVIYADPNWIYNQYGAKKHGSPKTHYALDKAVDIAKIPVEKWAKKDCVLILCATWPKLPQAFEVASAWGFNDYVTGIPWIKTSPNNKIVEGMLEGKTSLSGFDMKTLFMILITLIRTGIGHWFQSTSEMVLIFRRGKPPTPDGKKSFKEKKNPTKGILCGSEGVFYAPIKEHSAKPLMIYDWARAKLKGPYLELFARNQIHGWACWGHDTGFHLDENGVHELSAPPPPPPPPTTVSV